ncbi:MAG: 1,4-dihydroxy-6-naphthoate synthase [Bacteroidales bacterium]|nr:1,4-dihydroxy-6-naphthoate synthase [Bacteroidales bacterium]
MKLKIGFSPCPNDTFIFDAMVHGKVDTEGLEFDIILADVEELNSMAFNSALDISKISSHAYAYVAEKYLILESGSALGFGNGPLLIAKNHYDLDEVDALRIAIPGRYTTANLLLSIARPGALNRRVYLFSEIENAILCGEADAGLIIHETRFTYQKRGLIKIADLGEYWETLTGLPVPLGNIVIGRWIGRETAFAVGRTIRRSIEFAMQNPGSSYDFISVNAKEMEEEVIRKHIGLYVNEFSLQLGPTGKRALEEFFRIASGKGIIKELPTDIFLD